MKIKELFEIQLQAGNLPEVDISISFESMLNKETEFYKNLLMRCTETAKKYGVKRILFHPNEHTLVCSFTFPNEETFKNYPELGQAIYKICYSMQDIIESFEDFAVTWPPAFPLNFSNFDYSKITIYLPPNSTLTNIEKLLINVNHLEINNVENLAGGLLGILKIKELNTLALQVSKKTNLTKINQISKIISAHLKGDRNIAACQTELMKNGFKEYAKL